MECTSCKGSGESANPGQRCFLCSGSGGLCDVCGEPVTDFGMDLCSPCAAQWEDKEDEDE